MTTLDKHKSTGITKLLLIGGSGSGKTGALASLVAEGYKLRILDFDNGLDSLVWQVRKRAPDKLVNVEYRTLRDKRKATGAGPMLDGPAKAFVTALQMLDRWKYDDIDLGVPAQWGEDTVLVLDSLTFMSDAAWDWAEPMVPRNSKGEYDKRAVYGNAQKAIESVLALLTSEQFNCNVIVTSHIRYENMPDGSMKGWPTAVGAALGPTIPRYFNSVALCETIGNNRTITTASSALIDLKNPVSFKMQAKLPIETALADFFKTVRGT